MATGRVLRDGDPLALIQSMFDVFVFDRVLASDGLDNLHLAGVQVVVWIVEQKALGNNWASDPSALSAAWAVASNLTNSPFVSAARFVIANGLAFVASPLWALMAV